MILPPSPHTESQRFIKVFTSTRSGSLRYRPQRISEIIAALPVKPRIVLNSTVHPDRTLYTLHSTGLGVLPYRIQHHDELLAKLTEAGYKRRDG